MRIRAFLLALAAMTVTGQAGAFELILPDGTTKVAEYQSDPDSYALPIAPFADGRLEETELTGRVVTQAWRIDQPGLTTLEVTRGVEEQLRAAGFEIRLSCADQACGGFDFRFNTAVLPAPDMYVDLFDYRFVAAEHSDGQGVSVLVSPSATGALHLQVTHVVSDGGDRADITAPAPTAPEPSDDDTAPMIDRLTQDGHVILADLDFGTGSAALGPGPYASLKALAAYLLQDSARRVVLVGHTDFVGSLEDNVRLSETRANAVRSRLIEVYQVPPTQLDAEGVGYLSPIAPNATPDGREVNRRVEAVLLSTR